MVEVSITDRDGKAHTLLAEKIELVHFAERWCVHASSKKSGCTCPLDDVKTLTIGGMSIDIRRIPTT